MKFAFFALIAVTATAGINLADVASHCAPRFNLAVNGIWALLSMPATLLFFGVPIFALLIGFQTLVERGMISETFSLEQGNQRYTIGIAIIALLAILSLIHGMSRPLGDCAI
ncbi:MAG: hypothetical protein M3Z35_16735 [Nitrospirota bacterium]|nr:hypothetical protein [Nitrospirota bacterium]